MADEYKIYLINKTQSTQTFWAFLAPPQELASDPNVYANSSASLAVAAGSPGINTFTIPVQYVLSAGGSNQAVGLNVKVDSSITENAELTQLWEAQYQDVPPPMGPAMIMQPDVTPANTLGIQANNFNQAKNEVAGWFSSMSFGIKTAAGFMGMSWSPDPGTKRIITPTLEFYVTTGIFGSNTMASWTQVSRDAATVAVPRNFKLNAVTVIRTETGRWEIVPGKPTAAMLAGLDGNFSSLVRSHALLSQSHADLISVARNEMNSEQAVTLESVANVDGVQEDSVGSVVWDQKVETRDGLTHLSGTLTVQTALTAAFAFFILNNIRFTVTGHPSQWTVRFTYVGTETARVVKELFVAGAKLFFGNDKHQGRQASERSLPAQA
jgi:hypothetical protein